MDKTALEKIKASAKVITEQKEKIATLVGTIKDMEKLPESKEYAELRVHKLAFEVAEEMVAREIKSPDEFQEIVISLSMKSAEELKQRKNLLVTMSTEGSLDLGIVDTENQKIAEPAIVNNGSATPYSPESQQLADNMISTFINT